MILLLYNYKKLQLFDRDIFRGLGVVSLINTANIFFGLSSSNSLSVAMFTALRRGSIVITLLGEIYFLKQKKSLYVQITVYLMIVGALVAVIGDRTFSVMGYIHVFFANILTAASQVLTKKTLNKRWTKESILFTSAVVTFFWGTIYLLKYDWKTIQAWQNGDHVPLLVACSILGLGVNYGATWTIEENGPLTLAVVGSLKNITLGLLSCAGYIGHDYIFTWTNFTGLQIAAVASLLYLKATNIPTEEPIQMGQIEVSIHSSSTV